MCLYPASEGQEVPGFAAAPSDNTRFRTYNSDEPVNVAVHFATCLSQSCSVDREARCSAAPAAGTSRILVTSYGSFEQRTDRACTADCGFLIARCSTPALAAGEYTFEHGGASTTLTIPSTAAPPCVDTPGP
jgi:hypothetical protein